MPLYFFYTILQKIKNDQKLKSRGSCLNQRAKHYRKHWKRQEIEKNNQFDDDRQWTHAYGQRSLNKIKYIWIESLLVSMGLM